jgi:hypothetical protein
MTDVNRDEPVGFEDLSTAARTRDIMTRLMVKIIDQQRPPIRLGTVETIDPSFAFANISYQGAASVPVKIGAIRPTGAGQTVRTQDGWIVDVIGAAATTNPTPAEMEAPTGFVLGSLVHGVTADWSYPTGTEEDPVEPPFQYELQIADDNAFTVNVRTFFTKNQTYSLLTGFDPGDEPFGRVRGADSGTGRGPWSNVDSAVVDDFPQPSDGAAPGSSPQPVCTSMLGAVLAEWVPIVNADPVTYEVYASTVSGFTPGPTNKVGETDGTFFIVVNQHNGTPFPYSTNIFVRLIAKDADGSAAPGAQGFSFKDLVNTGDVGNIDTSKIHDGAEPTYSPMPNFVSGGIGFLFVRWDHVPNIDAVTYEVHISKTSSFLPGTNTYVGETPSNYFFIRNVGSGLGGGTLVFGDHYYVKLIAKDADGAADPGAQVDGFTTQANTVDIQVGAITAASGIIADLAVGTAKIQDAAITTLKVADLAVSSAKIQDAAIVTAKINDAAIVTAKIGDLQVTNAKINDLNVSKLTAGTITAAVIVMQGSSAVLKSSNFVTGPTGQGFQILGTGAMELNSVTVRGTVDASNITGSTITGSHIKTNNGTSYIELGPNYKSGTSIRFSDFGEMGTNGVLSTEFWITIPLVRFRRGTGAGIPTNIDAGSVIANFFSGGHAAFDYVDVAGSRAIDTDGSVRVNGFGGLYVNGSLIVDASRNTSFNAMNSGTISTFGAASIGGGLTVSGTLANPGISSSTDTGLPTVRSAFGTFVSVSSNEEYKTIVGEVPADYAALGAVTPIKFKSRFHKGDLGGTDDGRETHWGFGAGNLFAADKHLAGKDVQGNKPGGVNVDGVLALHHAILKDMNKRITALEAA